MACGIHSIPAWQRECKAMALLEVQNLQTPFRTPDGGVNRAVDGAYVWRGTRDAETGAACRRGRDRRHRGRVRLREVSDRNVYPAAYPRAAGSDGRSDPLQRQRFDEAVGTRNARYSRQ